MAFIPRSNSNKPEYGNIYYNTSTSTYCKGGISSACKGNANPFTPSGDAPSNRKGWSGWDVLPNCVGWAQGRYNEIWGTGKNKFWYFNCDAYKFADVATSTYNLKIEQRPSLGAIAVWAGGKSEYGHVAIVEGVDSDLQGFDASESGWTYTSAAFSFRHYSKTSSGWKPTEEGAWWHSSYSFIGFIPNYGVSTSDKENATKTTYKGGAVEEYEYEKHTKEVTVEYEKIITADNGTEGINQTKGTSLLSYPTNVESPCIIAKIGDYTFGAYEETEYKNADKTTTKIINYPNFIQSLEVTKINGAVNTYKLTLLYKITPNCDPNMVDKILSTVGYGTIQLQYGDWKSKNFIFKDETAVITSVTSNVDFASSKITYVISCTSQAVGLYATSVQFLATTDKPSNVIKSIIKGNYGITDVFPGMKNFDKLDTWIASNDSVVKIESKENIDPLSYINYLVTCMVANTNSADDVLLDSSYYLTMYDDMYENEDGAYFTVTQIKSKVKTVKSQNIYDLDIGYPSDNQLINFNINNDSSWSLLYNYSESIPLSSSSGYTYSIDDSGRIIETASPNFSTSATNYTTTASQKTWWTQMTQFPITATATIKGLVRPAMLMQYIRVNALFYGNRHIASGLYFVTKQVDKVDRAGYRTTLTLTRFAGDNDYIDTITEKQTLTYYVKKKIEQDPVLYDEDEKDTKENEVTKPTIIKLNGEDVEVQDINNIKVPTISTMSPTTTDSSPITISEYAVPVATVNKVAYAVEGSAYYRLKNNGAYEKIGTLKKSTYILGMYDSTKSFLPINKKYLFKQCYARTADVFVAAVSSAQTQGN